MNSKSNSLGWRLGIVLALGLIIGSANPLLAQKKKVTFRTKPIQSFALKVGHLVTGTGAVQRDTMMLIQGNKITAIGKDIKIPASARHIDLSKSWVFPGMVDCQSKASMPNDLKEPRDAIDLDNRPANAIVRGHRDFKLLAQSGITSVVISPEDDGVVSGVSAVVKTDGKGRLVTPKGPVSMSLTAKTRKRNRFPTSLMGAFQLLGQTMSKPQDDILKEVAANKRAAMVKLDTEAELRAYFRLANTIGLNCGIITDGSVRRVLDDMRGPMNIALPALGLNSPRRDLVLPRDLAKRKNKVTFFASTPGRAAQDLRYSAALAVKMGLERLTGVQSITKNAAEMAGAAGEIGTLEQGKDADFVVLSGHLLDLGASIEQTWIDGVPVYKLSKNTTEVTR